MDVLPVADRDGVGARNARVPWNGENGHGGRNCCAALPHHCRYGEKKDERGKTQYAVNDNANTSIEPTPKIACTDTDGSTYEHTDACRRDAHGEGHACAVDRAR